MVYGYVCRQKCKSLFWQKAVFHGIFDWWGACKAYIKELSYKCLTKARNQDI